MAKRSRIVVIGGGPAGCAAAIQCAQAGLEVVVLDSSAVPRDRPGETLHPGVEPLFERLGVSEAIRAAGFLRHEGIEVAWGGPPSFVPYGASEGGTWCGFQAWRSSLDAILRSRAAALGAEIRAGVHAMKPIVEEGRVVGVLTRTEDLRADWLIDAAGGGHWLARWLGLPIAKLSPPLLARYGYVRRLPGGTPTLLGSSAGWTWCAEVLPGLYQWTQLALSDPSSLPAVEGAPEGKTRAADVTWRSARPAAGPGYFLVGDAAAVLDPTSSHGVLRALMSGIMAGHAIANGDAGADDEKIVAPYRQWLDEWVERDVSVLSRLYQELGAPLSEPSPPISSDAPPASFASDAPPPPFASDAPPAPFASGAASLHEPRQESAG